MNAKSISPESIMALTSAHWSLKALSVGVDLSIFTILQKGPKTATQLAGLLNLPERSLKRLLNANVALGFLRKAHEGYKNSEVAQEYLIEGKPSYLGDFVKLAGIYGFAKWTRFEECIRNDAPIEDLDDDYRRNEERMQYFTRAMHNNAKGTARFIASLPLLANRSHLLDIGGGSGVYCIALTERFPDLHATLIDFPPVCKVAREYVGQSNAKNRIKIVEGDALRAKISDFGDIVLVSQVLHGMSESQCKALLKRCFNWTSSGGAIIVHEFLLDDDEVSPLYSTLFALNMLMTTKEGDAYTKGAVSNWLEHAGYRDLSVLETPGPSNLLVGHKK
ncbi:MAG: methyltransferase [Candidatus Hodarchaeota archaeon]